jgi:hypothetical protein
MGEMKSKSESVKHHVYGMRYRFIERASINELNRDVDRFCDSHDVKNVTLSTTTIDERGVALCDRINKCGSSAIIYFAKIQYLADITRDKMNADLEKYICTKLGKVSSGYMDVVTDRFVVPEELVQRIVDSDEYKELERRLEDKYSK